MHSLACMIKRVRYFLLEHIYERYKPKFFTPKMKVFTQKRNPISGELEWDMQPEDYDYHQEIARSAFADMLHDTERNKKYCKAIQLAIQKVHDDGRKANVLDIGTGTGLLSIMAARNGADSIVACEAFKPMAECCAKILKANNVADKITLVPKRSTQLTVGEDGDMKQKANILVTEVFDTELIGEGALSTFSHAHKHLLEENCIVIPDSAVVYAQVVQCPMLQKWNKLEDLTDEHNNVILKTPEKIKNCPGSAAVHDIQLSQVPRQAFRELSEQIPVFYYDWSGHSQLDFKRMVKQKFTAAANGVAQLVFMWWELNMDTEGKICLSCAPWWAHPDAVTTSERPQDTIPWRDHWMQAVYYLPQEMTVTENTEATLICCQDEYSLWFYLEGEGVEFKNYKRPICECGVHMAFSRTHVSYFNDDKRNNKFLMHLKEIINADSVVLELNDSSFYGLACAKMGAKDVYVISNNSFHSRILQDYVAENHIDNVHTIPELDTKLCASVTNVVCDPNFANSVLPWDDLKMAYLLYSMRDVLNQDVVVTPQSCELWGMPVEFSDLHKIRIPLGECEGIDMTVFDDLVENSRAISDAEIEAQPLWEYPCRSRGHPRKLLEIDLNRLKKTYSVDGSFPIREPSLAGTSVNAIALWCIWKVGNHEISCGPIAKPEVGERVDWDPHKRQAVKLLRKGHKLKGDDKWSYQVVCDLKTGQFNIRVDIHETG